ncbi:uncharacterized protein B0P05DRAFT_526114 [Gilbertella persicaria]|uniref:uncharacterized protein n=1 Tax=Gilbertella persicaria TaxID=101096 RepID=UPI00221F6BB6|nr:uncharacterized protein B0P05DRAFT_526114 [Gilbertella persicaria]KAI8092401.1 hypothetical protein B0P05DRAFT_526114 [Gilbertella persicaria]
MSQYQYLASYNFKAAFLFSYFSPGIMDIANRPLPKDFIKTKTKSAPILWIARNCHATNGREKYIEKLMEYVDVHSYGSCLNNKPFPDNKSRMDLLGEYKFYLSIENSNCDDYATEKLFDTMMMSSVPIVDGPPTYDGYIPNNRSVIYMDAYPDPKDLADYIQYLHNNDTAYLEYLAYRTHALDMAPKDRLDPDFISNWSDPSFHQQRSNYCAVCRGMLPWWAYHSDPHQTETYKDPDQEDYVLVDQSCAAPGKWNYILDGPPYHPPWTPRPRDEFTRPGTVIPETTPLPEATSLPETDHHSSVLIANLLFVLFFFMFLGVLFRLSKKESSQLPV